MARHHLSNTKDGSVGFLKSLWKSARWCQWFEENRGAEEWGKDVVFYGNWNNLGEAPLKMEKMSEWKVLLSDIILKAIV